MTTIVKRSEILLVGGYENGVYFSKDQLKEGDLLIAQSGDDEDWYDVKDTLEPPQLKSGYTMYILSKYVK